MLKVVDNWLGDEDLVRFLDRQFTYKTPHNYIEYADSTNAPPSIFGKKHNQETNSQIFYSHDFNPHEPLIKFLVIKAIETVEDQLGISDLDCVRCHLSIQHSTQDVEWHSDGSEITCVYTASTPGGGTFDFVISDQIQKIDFVKNKLIIFDGVQKHMAKAPESNRPRVLLVMKLTKSKSLKI